MLLERRILLLAAAAVLLAPRGTRGGNRCDRPQLTGAGENCPRVSGGAMPMASGT